MPTPIEARLEALATELKRAGITYHELTPMADTGLAHDHVWIHRSVGDDWVARLPKQSQMNLPPEENLAYQTACYQRSSPTAAQCRRAGTTACPRRPMASDDR